MIKKIVLVLLLSFILLVPVNSIFAKTISTPIPVASPSPTPVPIVSSFNLFWPVVAGKTMQSKLYFLKIWKENLRGLLIFGPAQKADYNIFLSTKRSLEAEVLMKGNVNDLANKTLDSAVSDLDKANSELSAARVTSEVDQDTKNEINSRVGNLKTFMPSLINQYPDYKDKLQLILDKLKSLTI